MGKIVEKKKKKKGRPSLLDLQKRNLREQQELQQQLQKRQHKKVHPHNHNHANSTPHSRDNYASAAPVRRSARRNPTPGEDSPEKPDAEEYDDDDDEDEEELAGKRREKKLKLVLRLPPNQNPEASLDSGGEYSNADEDAANGSRKRKINAISGGSGNKGDKSISGTKQSKAFQESGKLDSGPSTPLPDKKLLVFIIDRLQKKDTYGVFSDPVDPEELPDYHDVIEHPMDFGTLRKKLSSGAYSNLEEFEKDVFLICSNAMQYNAPETVYFRQARSIHELAKKNFENLRQDSDDSEPEPKIVRRGRPPTKNLKKSIVRPSSEGLGPEISSDPAAIATGIDNSSFSNHDLRKSYNNLSEKSGVAAESSERLHGLRSDLYSNWLADNKFDRSDELTGSLMRSNMKNGKKQVVHEESRRNTYVQPHQSVAVREPSVLMTFDAERKQLMPVGVLVEHGYARSLARFAANLGPVAWKVASKKIERSLPTGTKFGPGWVGENDLPKSKMPQHISNSPNSSHTQTSSVTADPKAEILAETPVRDNLSDKEAPRSSSSGPMPTNKSPPEPITPKPESLESTNPQFPVLNNAAAGTRPKSPFPAQKWAMIRPGMNGFNGFNLAGLAQPPGLKEPSSHTLEKSSRTNNNNSNDNNNSDSNNNNNNTNDSNDKINNNNDDKVIESVNALKPEETNKAIRNRGTRSSLPTRPLPPPPAPPGPPQPRPTWHGQDSGLSPKRKPDSVPPDLNVGFQSPGSPSSSRVDSTQPDLALQL